MAASLFYFNTNIGKSIRRICSFKQFLLHYMPMLTVQKLFPKFGWFRLNKYQRKENIMSFQFWPKQHSLCFPYL